MQEEQEPGAFSKESRSLKIEHETRQATGVRHGQTLSSERKNNRRKNGNEMMPIGPEVSKIHALN